MHHAHRYINSVLLAVLLATPMAIMATPKPQNASIQVRVYDRNHKDYHNWDDHEDRAYRGYLDEHHQTYRVYANQPRRTQHDYWSWRHSHPDRD